MPEDEAGVREIQQQLESISAKSSKMDRQGGTPGAFPQKVDKGLVDVSSSSDDRSAHFETCSRTVNYGGVVCAFCDIMDLGVSGELTANGRKAGFYILLHCRNPSPLPASCEISFAIRNSTFFHVVGQDRNSPFCDSASAPTFAG